MAKNYFMDEVSVLKQVLQEAGRIREYSAEEMKKLLDEKIEQRVEWAKINNPDLYWYYQNLNNEQKHILLIFLNFLVILMFLLNYLYHEKLLLLFLLMLMVILNYH